MANTANVMNVDEATFEQDVVQKSFDKPVVVDFWAAWCGPCRMLGPVLEKLANEPESNFILAKVDVDANPNLAMRFGVQGIPAVKAFSDGQVAGEFVGAQPEPMVRDFIKSIAPSESDLSLETAEDLLNSRNWEEADRLFLEFITNDPDNVTARLGYARSLIGQGQGCRATTYLEELLLDLATIAQAERLMPVANFICSFAENGDKNAELTIIEAQYRRSAQLLADGKIAPALDGLLEVLRHNKDYHDGQAKQVMLSIFEFLGDQDPLTNAYRREMASVLF